ncbi:hypothetical protein F5B20DRAFT_597450 [Whalleya microplaca]|nr:hypothetical protein F5B20DRAFT_597450 [Whalleya microplaca]
MAEKRSQNTSIRAYDHLMAPISGNPSYRKYEEEQLKSSARARDHLTTPISQTSSYRKTEEAAWKPSGPAYDHLMAHISGNSSYRKAEEELARSLVSETSRDPEYSYLHKEKTLSPREPSPLDSPTTRSRDHPSVNPLDYAYPNDRGQVSSIGKDFAKLAMDSRNPRYAHLFPGRSSDRHGSSTIADPDYPITTQHVWKDSCHRSSTKADTSVVTQVKATNDKQPRAPCTDDKATSRKRAREVIVISSDEDEPTEPSSRARANKRPKVINNSSTPRQVSTRRQAPAATKANKKSPISSTSRRAPTRRHAPSTKASVGNTASRFNSGAYDSDSEDDLPTHSFADDFQKLRETAMDPRYKHLF